MRRQPRTHRDFREVSPGASPPESPSPDPETSSLKNQLELLRPPSLLLFLEKLCASVVWGCCLLIPLLSILNGSHPTLWGEHEIQYLGFTLLIWASEAFGIALVFVEISKTLS